jgi:chromosomal replication initiation ATPase DnaA
MPAVKVAECETAADVWRLARKIERVHRGGIPIDVQKEIARLKKENGELNRERNTFYRRIEEMAKYTDELTQQVRLLSINLEKYVPTITAKGLAEELGNLARLTMAEIMKATCDYYCFTREEMRGPRQTAAVARARQLCYFIARRHTHMSLSEIGRCFNRDHTTVMHGVQKIERAISEDEDVARAINQICLSLGILDGKNTGSPDIRASAG